MGLGLLGGKFYPPVFGSPLRRGHLFGLGVGAFSRAAVWQGQRFRVKHGQKLCVLAAAVVSCFGQGSNFLFWWGQWFPVLLGAAVSSFGEGCSLVF